MQSAYKPEAGRYALGGVHRTSLPFPKFDKDLAMRVVFPEAPGSYPLIVLSHGNGCYQDLYNGITDHWASWGYVVIQPVHMDSPETGFSLKGQSIDTMDRVVASRREDVSLILDSLDQLESQVPGLKGKIDREHFIASGHSMGGGTMMSLTGVVMQDPRSGEILKSDEDRFEALVLISDPNNARMMPTDPWRMVRVPTFIATGTEDFSTIGARNGKAKTTYQLVGDDMPDQPRYYLNTQGSDHYLGGLICKDTVPGPEDAGALLIANGATTAFLDAYAKDDETAQQFLKSGLLPELTDGRSTLELR